MQISTFVESTLMAAIFDILQELIGNTDPADPEYSQLITAADVVKEAVTFVNEEQRKAEERLQDRMKKIEDLSASYAGISELNLSADVNRDLSMYPAGHLDAH